MTGLKQVSPEVFIATDSIVQINEAALDVLRKAAALSPNGRARICAHRQSSDALHEMIIALRQDTYIRPHRHRDKVESFHVINGTGRVVIFDESGNIDQIVILATDAAFFYRLDTPRFHTVLVDVPVLLIHEVTNGPFVRTETEFASWAPQENAPRNEVARYIARLHTAASGHHCDRS